MRRGRRTLRLLGLLAVSCVAFAIVASWWPWIVLRQRMASAGFVLLEENPEGLQEYRHQASGLVFVLLPGGTFPMGSPDTEPDRASDERQHRVTLSPFLIAKHEVSVADWRRTMGRDPSFHKRPDHPVVNVSWNDIQRFEARTGLGLPTEAQWEYACRAGTTTPFAYGWHISSEVVSYNGGILLGGRLKAVGSFAPNAFGLHDMHGNVYEWCEDVYDASRHTKSEAANGDLASTVGSSDRVIRGGGFISFARHCRSALRDASDPGLRDRYIGFAPRGRRAETATRVGTRLQDPVREADDRESFAGSLCG